MEYFEVNVIFVGHILGIECVLTHPFPWQYFLPYTIHVISEAISYFLVGLSTIVL